jgi:hypothetical protein
MRRSHFGVFEFLLDGRKLGPNLDLYHPEASVREFALPAVPLDAGEHVLTVHNLGKEWLRNKTGNSIVAITLRRDDRGARLRFYFSAIPKSLKSTGYCFGLDAILLNRRE